MTVNYQRLTYKQRVGIYYLLKQGCSQREIARQLEVSPSTISRNKTGQHYFPQTAQHKTRDRCFKRMRKLDISPLLRQVVIRALRRQWSPEQISAYLKKTYDNTDMHIAPETLYTYLYVLPLDVVKAEADLGFRGV